MYADASQRLCFTTKEPQMGITQVHKRSGARSWPRNEATPSSTASVNEFKSTMEGNLLRGSGVFCRHSMKAAVHMTSVAGSQEL
eukprot:44866-Pelagomonas_calceolata.AAC.2